MTDRKEVVKDDVLKREIRDKYFEEVGSIGMEWSIKSRMSSLLAK